MTSTPDERTARLIEARDLARAALLEITPEATIGEPAGHRVEDDAVVSLLFENALSGYPGWKWTVTLAQVDDEEPTVLEVELLPDEGALLAPDWVPWAERLAEYQAALAAAEAEKAAAAEDDDDLDEDDEDDDLDDEDDLDEELDELDDVDESDFETDGSAILHSGDLDGVDIDELDVTDTDDEDSDQEESDEEESDEEE